MERREHSVGVNVQDAVYEGSWHNETSVLKFRMPDTFGDSLTRSPTVLPDAEEFMALEINERLLAERHEEAMILKEFNEAYGGEMEQEDREFLNQAKDYRRRKSQH